MSPAPTPTAITETMRPCNAPAYCRTFDPPGEFPLDDSKRLCVHLLEKAIASLPEGGETLVGIFDLRGFGNRNADLGFVRFLVRKWPGCRVNHGKLQLHQYKPVWIEHPSQAFGARRLNHSVALWWTLYTACRLTYSLHTTQSAWGRWSWWTHHSCSSPGELCCCHRCTEHHACASRVQCL